MNLEQLRSSLEKSWSRETCYPTDQHKWTKEDPGLGQCGVTALVVWYFFGGEILEKRNQYGRAFYNRLPDGTIIDLSGQDCDKAESEARTRDPRELMRGHTKRRFLILLDSLGVGDFSPIRN